MTETREGNSHDEQTAASRREPRLWPGLDRPAFVADDLRQLVAEFEDYLAHCERWSRRAFNEYHDRFKVFGIGRDTSITDEILRQARTMLPGGLV